MDRIVAAAFISHLTKGLLAELLRVEAPSWIALLPEVYVLKGVQQPGQVHAEGDAFAHTLLVLEHAKPTPLAQWAALLHDTGKARTQLIEPGGKISFLGHEKASAEIAAVVLERFGVDPELKQQIVTVVANHMRVRDHRRWGPRALRRFVHDLGPLVPDVLDLFEADGLGSLTPSGAPAKDGVEELRLRIQNLPPMVEPRPKPLLSGDVIMRVLGIGPGPAVGEVQKWLEERAQVWAGLGKVVDAAMAEQLIVDEYASLISQHII
jgi:poly(A) polymerase